MTWTKYKHPVLNQKLSWYKRDWNGVQLDPKTLAESVSVKRRARGTAEIKHDDCLLYCKS